jgi:tripartite-type tricarboxylate transporter receptor subunit TctC
LLTRLGLWIAGTSTKEAIPKSPRLNREILADPKMQARLGDLGDSAIAGSPADFSKLIAEETEKWGKVVKLSGASARLPKK